MLPPPVGPTPVVCSRPPLRPRLVLSRPLLASASYDYIMPGAPYWLGAIFLVVAWSLVARVWPVRPVGNGDAYAESGA